VSEVTAQSLGNVVKLYLGWSTVFILGKSLEVNNADNSARLRKWKLRKVVSSRRRLVRRLENNATFLNKKRKGFTFA
jgi:hypothetical protein